MIESRLGADIYDEKSMQEEFLYRSGDMHSLCAYLVYKEEIPRDTPIQDIKHLYPKLRKEVKSVEFSQQFGGSEYAIQNAMGCTIERAREFKKAYDEGFPGITAFKKRGSAFVRKNGYVLMCKYTGHKMYWYGHNEWLEEQKSYTQEFWEDYRQHHKGTGDSVARAVSEHAKTGAYWDRMALNSVTQGTGAVCMKDACIDFYHWILKNNLFGIVKICDLVHDEICIEYPESMPEVGDILEKTMENSAAKYCKAVPIPAEKAVGKYWIH